ncbi:MAG: hypothetical protein I8H75_03860 [Myxococcaceae bacterium]|nr:hypothetical protein [Myxococcaceae bacterium]MBH2006463.1 hypothetical protein [Myxococcaceae bacterium]
MKLIILLSIIFSSFAFSEPNFHCDSDLSRSGRVVWIEAELPEPVMEEPTIVPPKAVATLSSTTSIIAPPSQIAQTSRAQSLQSIISCNNDSPAAQALAWSDNPTTLTVGSGATAEELGAVIGNWVLLVGIASGWTLLAQKFDPALLRHPGGIVAPALFLFEPTVGATITLLASDDLTAQIVGSFSTAALLAGTSLVAFFLHPKNFKAQWLNNEWSDLSQPGYVKRFGMLFEAYSQDAHYFMTGELFMSAMTSMLNAFRGQEMDCRGITTAASILSSAYALFIVLKRPHANIHRQRFYSAIATIQALTITIQAIALWVGSGNAYEEVSKASSNMMAATQWALFAMNLYELGLNAYEWFHHFRSFSNPMPSVDPTLEDLMAADPLTALASALEPAEAPRIENAIPTPPPALPRVESADSISLFSSRSSTPILLPTDFEPSAFLPGESDPLEDILDPYLQYTAMALSE